MTKLRWGRWGQNLYPPPPSSLGQECSKMPRLDGVKGMLSEIRYYIIKQSLLYCLKLLECSDLEVGDITDFILELILIAS